jgi:hypothetical protein
MEATREEGGFAVHRSAQMRAREVTLTEGTRIGRGIDQPYTAETAPGDPAAAEPSIGEIALFKRFIRILLVDPWVVG